MTNCPFLYRQHVKKGKNEIIFSKNIFKLGKSMFRFSEFLFCDFAWIRGIKYSKLKIPLSMTEYAIALFYKTSNNSSILSCLLTFILIQTISIRNKYFNQFSSVYMLWFNFILGSNFLFFCFWVL